MTSVPFLTIPSAFRSLSASSPTLGISRVISSGPSLAQKCTPDASGRIILDEGLLKYAGINKNIVFVGAGKQIRIWSEEKWTEREQNRNYEEMRNKMRSYGL